MSTSKKMITLKTSDGESFEVVESIALQSQTIAHMIEDNCVIENGVPLQNVTSKVLAKVLEYCKKHDGASSSEDLNKFDAEFMNIKPSLVMEIMLAAYYLKIKSLLDLTQQTVSDFISAKNVDQIRELFGIENCFSPEKEAENRKENPWAYE